MERKFLPRFIIIDGINVMKELNESFDVNLNKTDRRMNPMVLVPLVNALHQNGFRMRIIMEKMPSVEEVKNRYILKEMIKLNILLFSQSVCYPSPELLMLYKADEYGGMIISNRTFETHQQEYQNIIENNVIKFMRSLNNGFMSSEIHETDVDFQYSLSFYDDFDKFYCYDDDQDFAKVKISQYVFRMLTASNIKYLDILVTYIYARFSLTFGSSTSRRSSGMSILIKENEEFPATFEEFKFRCLS